MRQILFRLAIYFFVNKCISLLDVQYIIFVLQITMHGDEVEQIASHLTMSLGLQWDAMDFSALSAAIKMFR